MIAGSAMLLHPPHWDAVRAAGIRRISALSQKTATSMRSILARRSRCVMWGTSSVRPTSPRPTTRSWLSLRLRCGAVHGRQGRDHPPRPTRGHAREGFGRDHAHLPLVPRDKHAEAPRPTWCSWGSGGWQVPRSGVKVGRERGSTCLTVSEIEKIGVDKTIEIGLQMAFVEGGPRML
jgi:hypothetical protein